MKQLTIIGVGLIGGSFALSLKKRGFRGRIVGCDRGEVLAHARERNAIDAGDPDPARAVHGADVILLATPVGAILDFLDRVGPHLPPTALVTDVGSTKREIVARAHAVFGESAPQRFVAGHPMAGKEHGGIEHADADLFQGATWVFTPLPEQNLLAGTAGEFLKYVEEAGAHVATMDAERHDRLMAWISHLPQMVSTALASSLEEEFGDDPELLSVGGRALREMTRIAASPYSMWRDIALTNTTNIEEALLRLEQKLAHLRENLKTRELEEEFENANRFRAKRER